MRKLVVLAASLGMLAALSAPSPALASGAFTQTQHVSSMVIPMTPMPGWPASCPVQLPLVFVSNGGNGLVHQTANGNGFWFTTTYEGDTTIFVLLGFDSAGGPILGAPTFQGHMSVHFGQENNKQNSVFHTTIAFHGTGVTDPSQSVTIDGGFGVTTNANGDVTSNPIRLGCH
jgi:hypothetical protein